MIKSNHHKTNIIGFKYYWFFFQKVHLLASKKKFQNQRIREERGIDLGSKNGKYLCSINLKNEIMLP